jgi:hypothetical protein
VLIPYCLLSCCFDAVLYTSGLQVPTHQLAGQPKSLSSRMCSSLAICCPAVLMLFCMLL